MRLVWVRSFLRLPPVSRRMALEATLLLAASRVLVLFVPMRYWRGRLDTAARSPVQVVGDEAETGGTSTGKAVGHMVDRVARCMPFKATCLCQAMTSQWLLRRRRVASQLYVGVRRRADGTVALHSWLTVDGTCVVGKRVERYRPLGAAAEVPPRRVSPARLAAPP